MTFFSTLHQQNWLFFMLICCEYDNLWLVKEVVLKLVAVEYFMWPKLKNVPVPVGTLVDLQLCVLYVPSENYYSVANSQFLRGNFYLRNLTKVNFCCSSAVFLPGYLGALVCGYFLSRQHKFKGKVAKLSSRLGAAQH